MDENNLADDATDKNTYQHLRQQAEEAGASNIHKSSRRLRIPIDTNQDVWAMPIEDINVANPELFKHNLQTEYFTRLRAEAPVHYCSDSQYGPYWSISGYRDIIKIEKDIKTFSSSFEYGGVTLMGTARTARQLPMFIQMDPPDHDGQRQALQPKFAMRSLTEIEVLIRQRVCMILDGLPVNEEFNWVEHVSIELTARMLATLLDVPQEDRKLLIHWSDAFGGPDNPEVVPDYGSYLKALAEAGDYFWKLWQDRSKSGGTNDLIAMLANGEHTKNMDSNTFLGNMVLLIVGGSDTTRNSISGSVLALNKFPVEYDKLLQNKALISSMVPEIIRWQTPLAHMRRTATRNVSFGGENIRKGEKVVVWYISGNRDESVIQAPEDFIIDRPRPREHLSFGFGVHRCLGNRLAEMQLRVLWEEITNRNWRIEVCGDPIRVSSCFLRGYHELPVRISA